MADLIGQVTLLPPDLGGRRTAAYSGYCPDARLPSGAVSFTLRFMCYDALSPGESDAAMIEVSPQESAATIGAGDVFNLVEGAKVIGKVEVLENLWKQRQTHGAGPAPAALPAYQSLSPVLGVSDMDESIAFFGHLGFEVGMDHHDDTGARLWARLRRGGLDVQLTQLARAPMDPAHRVARGTLALYIATEDIHGLHSLCQERGLTPSALVKQFYGATEFDVHTPDGWRVLFGQFTR